MGRRAESHTQEDTAESDKDDDSARTAREREGGGSFESIGPCELCSRWRRCMINSNWAPQTKTNTVTRIPIASQICCPCTSPLLSRLSI